MAKSKGKKDKAAYAKGGVIGTAEYGKKPKYEDGGIVSDAKKNALLDLKSKMANMGGDSLFSSLDNQEEDAYKDGGVVKASVIAKDKKGLKEGLEKAADIVDEYKMDHDDSEDSDDYGDLSREELLKLLRHK